MKKEILLMHCASNRWLLQRNYFEAEKNVAVADTSIHNLQRTIAQIEEEQTQA